MAGQNIVDQLRAWAEQLRVANNDVSEMTVEPFRTHAVNNLRAEVAGVVAGLEDVANDLEKAPALTDTQRVLDAVNRMCLGGQPTPDEIAEITLLVGEVFRLRRGET